MMIRRRNLLGEGYKKLEYIKTSGEQLINTDWFPLIDAKIELYFHLKNYKVSKDLNNSLFGASNSKDYYVFTVNNGGGANQYNDLFMWNNLEYGYGGRIFDKSCLYYHKSETPLYFSMEKTKATMINEYGKKTDVTLDTRSGYNEEPLVLFGVKDKPYNRAEMYIYGVKCWNDGILEKDFVPAKKKGICGLYDKIQGVFWESSTDVGFIGSDEAVTTEYLEDDEELIDGGTVLPDGTTYHKE